MTQALVCWKCGASIADHPLPLSRAAECRNCRADLHVCRMCEFYDTRVAKACREPIAEEVKDKERSNFCDYFRAKANAYKPQDGTAEREALAKLDALFGLSESEPKREEATGAVARLEAEDAKKQLEGLFGLNDKSGK
jgi:hypothetical protein